MKYFFKALCLALISSGAIAQTTPGIGGGGIGGGPLFNNYTGITSQCLHANAAGVISGTGSDCAAGGGASPANPTGTVGLSAVNGSAATFLRSDGAPPLSQSITPTWTGVHTYTAAAPQIVLGVNTSILGAVKMFGNTSGDLTLNPAAVAGTASKLTFPAGITDFSSTGGSSQVVKQTSAGGAFTVGQLANTDITGFGTMSTQNANGVAVTGGTLAGLTGFGIRDTSAAFDVTLAGTSSTALTAGRILTIDMKNVAHTLALGSTANTITFPSASSYTVIGSGDSGTVTNTILATAPTNTVKGNATSGTASDTDLAVGGCSAAGSALNWTTNTGFGCNTAITATAAATGVGSNLSVNSFNWGIPIGIPPSGTFKNNGVYVIGALPSSSATCALSQIANGSAYVTCSAATLLGTAADQNRVFTILDSATYRYCTITAQNTTTQATCTISNGSFTTNSATVTSVAITGTAGQFSCTCTNLVVGQSLTISGTFGGTGSITGYSNPTTYYVSATNGTSTFTLQTTPGSAIVTTTGTPSGLTYTPVGTASLANANIFLSGTPTTNTSAFPVPLNTAYGSAYMYFGANVICSNSGNCGGSAQNAGIFYATCTTTTLCTVYNNTISTGTTGLPTVPGSPTAFASTGAGAFTQTTGLAQLLSLTIPANSLGPNGSLVFEVQGVRNSNADTIALEPFWNGIQVGQLSVVSVVWYDLRRMVRNLGVTNAQAMYCATCSAAATDQTTANNATTYTSIDTTVNENLNFKAILSSSANDWFFTQGGTVSVNYAP